MATLQKIRNKLGLLVAVVIGFSLLAFILGDFLNKGSVGSPTEIGEIAGDPVPYVDFSAKYEEALENTRQNTGNTSIDDNTHQKIRDQIWQQLIRSYIMDDEYAELGISVSNEEVFDMVQGENIHPQVRRLFANPETGAVDQAQILQILKSIHQDGNMQRKLQWKKIEEELISQRMYEKYMNLIRKGLFVTSQQAKAEFNNTNHKVNFSFISQNYALIADSTVSISEKEIEEYYNENIDNYQQEASRDIEFVSFDVRASADDDKAAQEDINELKNDFENEAEIVQFVNLESDAPFDTKYYKEREHSAIVNDNLFNKKIGDTFGPYVENATYKLARVADIKFLPDSVNARHILIQPEEKTAEAQAKALALADSLENIINSNNFANLARQYSKDPSSGAKGGDLGWFQEGAMVPSFNDACIFGKEGDIVSVESQFGIHIIEILKQGKKQKRIQVAILERKVTPSDQTQHEIYTKASEFAGINNTFEKFDAAITEQRLRKIPANNLKEADRFISGLESPRSLIIWAYKDETKEKAISEVFTFGNKFVVACVTKIKEKGDAPIEDVKFEIESILRKEKKGSILAEKINTFVQEGKSFEEIATSLETEVKSAENISFNSYTIPDTGNEPKLISTALGLEKDQISEPIKGNIGVYLVRTDLESDLEATDYDLEKSKLTNTISSRVYQEAFEALKENANIQDNRAKFY